MLMINWRTYLRKSVERLAFNNKKRDLFECYTTLKEALHLSPLGNFSGL